ncbi:unnamed protein product [Camellia sinensis]
MKTTVLFFNLQSIHSNHIGWRTIVGDPNQGPLTAEQQRDPPCGCRDSAAASSSSSCGGDDDDLEFDNVPRNQVIKEVIFMVELEYWVSSSFSGGGEGEMTNASNNKNDNHFFKSILFFDNNKKKSSDADSPRPIALLSSLANSVCRWQLLKILKGPSQLDYEHNEEKFYGSLIHVDTSHQGFDSLMFWVPQNSIMILVVDSRQLNGLKIAWYELLFRLIESFNRLQVLATWQDPWKSTMFLGRWQLLKILKGPSQLDYEHNEEKFYGSLIHVDTSHQGFDSLMFWVPQNSIMILVVDSRQLNGLKIAWSCFSDLLNHSTVFKFWLRGKTLGNQQCF